MDEVLKVCKQDGAAEPGEVVPDLANPAVGLAERVVRTLTLK